MAVMRWFPRIAAQACLFGSGLAFGVSEPIMGAELFVGHVLVNLSVHVATHWPKGVSDE